MATSFGWKRKMPQKLARKKPVLFHESNQKSDVGEDEPYEEDWGVLLVKRGALSIEDKVVKSKRLTDEGIALAEQERYWEAITRWNEAISLVPNNEKLHEMKSQALLELQELYPAIQEAEKAVLLNPRWYVAYQTLGRAQMGFGDVEMGLKSFSRAVHLRPDDIEMWTEDLHWALTLRNQQRRQEAKDKEHNTDCLSELSELYPVDPEERDEKIQEVNQSGKRTQIEEEIT